MWPCVYCDKEFKYESEKRRHEQSHVPQFECKVCSKKFSFNSALRRHEKQHERKESVECSTCRRKFKDETLLKRHIQYAHEGTYSCKKCKATLHSELALRTHMKTHKPMSERMFRCTHTGCSKSFNFAHHLKHHELTHSNDKPHVCKECGKSFIQLHHLKVHQQQHQPDNWLDCPMPDCTKIFTHKYALKRHLTTHKSKVPKPRRKTLKKEEMLYVLLMRINRDTPFVDEDRKSPHDSDEKFSVHTHKTIGNISDDETESKNSDVNSAFKRLNMREIYNTIPAVAKKLKMDDFKSENLISSYNFDVAQDIMAINKLDDQATDTFDEFDSQVGLDENVELDDINISNCKSVIGKCLVDGDLETSDGCLCAQISSKEKTTEFNSSIIPRNNNVINLSMIDEQKCLEKRKNDVNACENCECASICSIRNKERSDYIQLEIPQLEHRNDGIIKIKDESDLEAGVYDQDKVVSKINVKAKVNVMKSCKDIIGNCIVSGDGTMGEGCLCARMTADDQLIIAQEIEEITPHPQF